MANVIDAFLVTLGLDGTKFSTGVDQARKDEGKLEDVAKRRDAAEKRRQAEQERLLKKASDGYRRLRNDAIALAAVFTAGVGIKDFITNTINSAVNLGYLSANLGQSTERLKAWQLASERAGGSQEGVIAQLKESVDSIAALNSGLGPNEGIQWFFRLGGSSADLKDGNTYLLARSKIINDMFKVDPGKAALIAKQLGISEDQFNFIKQGPDAINDLIASQEKYAAISAKDAEAALKLRNQFLALRNSLELTATGIVLQLAPALERLFAKLERGGQWVADHKDDIALWVENSVTAIRDFVRWADAAAESVGGWKNVLIGLTAIRLVGFIASLTSIAVQLASIAGSAPVVGAALGVLGKAGAVGAAGVGGYAAGTYAYNNLLSDNVKDIIGEGIARTFASFGHQDSRRAVNTNVGREEYYLDDAPKKPAPPPPPPKPTGPTADQISSASSGRASALAKFLALEAKYGLPSGTLDSVWSAESNRSDPKFLRSGAGAEGPFQFMPKTAKEYGLKNPYDFDESADAAARKYRDLLKLYGGDINKAAAAYNFGQGNLSRVGGVENAPKETRDYVAKVAGGLTTAAAPGARPANVQRSSNSTSEVNIQNMTINTKATDAKGIAREIKPAMEQYSYTNNANSGMVE